MDELRSQQEMKERAHRHHRLMKMINNYSRTAEESKKLDKIKSNTMMEINIRYLRCEHNRKYRFPLNQEDSEEEEELNYDPFLPKKENVIYDLNSQNSVKPSRSPSKKTLSLQSSRRVVSLEGQRNQWRKQRLFRLDLKAKHNFSNKSLTKKNSFSQKVKASGSRIRLPQLKIQKYRQNLKTEKSAPEDEKQIESVVSKKLITESCEGRKKMNGVEKYLQKIDTKVKTKVQRFHKE